MARATAARARQRARRARPGCLRAVPVAGIVPVVAREARGRVNDAEVAAVRALCDELVGRASFVDDAAAGARAAGRSAGTTCSSSRRFARAGARARGRRSVRARVGTVDAFQGQEAPVVIISLVLTGAERDEAAHDGAGAGGGRRARRRLGGQRERARSRSCSIASAERRAHARAHTRRVRRRERDARGGGRARTHARCASSPCSVGSSSSPWTSRSRTSRRARRRRRAWQCPRGRDRGASAFRITKRKGGADAPPEAIGHRAAARATSSSRSESRLVHRRARASAAARLGRKPSPSNAGGEFSD